MTAVFLDTSYLVALLRRDDVHHAAAVALRPQFEGPLVTTEYVLVEFLDSLASPATRSPAAAAVEAVRSYPHVKVVPASTALYDEAVSLYRSRADKGWGLTDCVSFIVMQREGIADALTADRHFEQAGFRALLRSALQ